MAQFYFLVFVRLAEPPSDNSGRNSRSSNSCRLDVIFRRILRINAWSVFRCRRRFNHWCWRRQTILNFQNQVSSAQGLLVTSDRVLLKDFAIEDAKGMQ